MRLRPSPLLIVILAASALLPASLSSQDVEPEPRPNPPAPAPDDKKPDDVQPTPVPNRVPKAVITTSNGQPVPVSVPIGEPIILSAGQSVAGDLPTSYIWQVEPKERAERMQVVEDGKVIIFGTGMYATDIRVRLIVALDDMPAVSEVTIHVTGPRPPPVPPPTPDPDDNDPEPEPKPDERPPFPSDGLSVLITYQTEKQADMPAGQRAIIFGREIREFLDGVCKVGPDGKTREYRIWDADADVTAAPEKWQKAMAVPREADLWLVVSNGKAGYSGPLPASPEEFKAIVGPLAE